MEEASPARLYATVVGAFLVIFGILGFFYTASFGSPGTVEDVLGAFAANGWENVFHILTGALGLLVAGFEARRYALGMGLIYFAIAIWGFAIGSGESILGFMPVNSADNFLHLILGGLGVAAAMATPLAGARRAPAT